MGLPLATVLLMSSTSSVVLAEAPAVALPQAPAEAFALAAPPSRLDAVIAMQVANGTTVDLPQGELTEASDDEAPAADSTEAPELAGNEAPSPEGNLDAAGADGTGASVDDTILVTGSMEAPQGDPLVQINQQAFDITQNVDKAVVEPVAEVYEEGLPKPIRHGLRNFIRNLLEPVNFLNFLLQLKPGKALETLGRFTINSTVGIGGLIDVAKREPFNLPYRRNGLANTLGYYGVGPGPFLVLPLIGATTLRDVTGSLVDQSIVPLAIGAPFNTPYYGVPAYTVNALEYRIEFDEYLQSVNDSVDPYSTMRETYLCQREAEIAELKNRPPRDCSLPALFPDEYRDFIAGQGTDQPEAAAPAPEAGQMDIVQEVQPGVAVEVNEPATERPSISDGDSVAEPAEVEQVTEPATEPVEMPEPEGAI